MKPTIVLLPGLGADQRRFQLQPAATPDLLIPSWPVPRPQDSLPAYAARLADAIPSSDCLYLGGSSFGGMVALELAALLRPKGGILIGGCTSPGGVAARGRDR